MQLGQVEVPLSQLNQMPNSNQERFSTAYSPKQQYAGVLESANYTAYSTVVTEQNSQQITQFYKNPDLNSPKSSAQ